jgi:UDPglucose 6-dehydrogenase
MKLSVVGTGYVGLVTGACLADTGNHVVGLDVDAEKIKRLSAGHCPIFEPGLEELIERNLAAGRLRFTTNAAEAVTHGRVLFIAIGTPPLPDGRPDMSYIERAADTIAELADGPKIVVIKSTVPVGTGARIEQRIAARCRHKVHLVSNPEFLKEGSAVDDFQRPDRVVIGAEAAEAAEIIRELHLPFVRNLAPIIVCRRAAAELVKYAANVALAMRISFINAIANLCDRFEIDVNDVRAGLMADARIGKRFLYPGPGYGGSCFPKDVQALAHTFREAGLDGSLIEAVHEVNLRQRRLLLDKIIARFGEPLRGRRIALWGVAFKPQTDDIREAPALTLIDLLLEAGVEVHAHDPAALDNLRRLYGQRVYCHDDPYEALDGADALVVVTEWNEFRNPDFDVMRERLRQPVIFDGRNLYASETMRRYGFECYYIGRPPVTPKG